MQLENFGLAYSPDAISIQVQGKAETTILSSDLDDRIEVSGNGSRTNVLALGVVNEQKRSDYFTDRSTPGARAALVNSRQLSALPGMRTVPTPNFQLPTSNSQLRTPNFEPPTSNFELRTSNFYDGWLLSMLEQTRKTPPANLAPLPSGVTDVRLFRVWVSNGLHNISLNP